MDSADGWMLLWSDRNSAAPPGCSVALKINGFSTITTLDSPQEMVGAWPSNNSLDIPPMSKRKIFHFTTGTNSYRDSEGTPIPVMERGHDGTSPLHWAAWSGVVKLARRQCPATLDRICSSHVPSWSSLQVRLVLEHGDEDVPDDNGQTPLMWAADRG